jgi:hypothetical protein
MKSVIKSVVKSVLRLRKIMSPVGGRLISADLSKLGLREYPVLMDTTTAAFKAYGQIILRF